MSNKEFINRLKNIDMIYKTDENGNVSEIISCGETYENHFKQLEKDLEELEELKKIMGTPIQDIMKRLKILEIIKKWSFLDTFYWEDNDTTYDRFLCNIHTKGMKEDFEKVKEWLENE